MWIVVPCRIATWAMDTGCKERPKKAAIPDRWVARLVSKGTYNVSLSQALRQGDLCIHSPHSLKVYIKFLRWFGHVFKAVSMTRCSLKAASLQMAPCMGTVGRGHIARAAEGARSFRLPSPALGSIGCYIVTFSSMPSTRRRRVRTWRPQAHCWPRDSSRSLLAWRTLPLGRERDRAAYLSISRGVGSSISLLDPWGEVPLWLIASQWDRRCTTTT